VVLVRVTLKEFGSVLLVIVTLSELVSVLFVPLKDIDVMPVGVESKLVVTVVGVSSTKVAEVVRAFFSSVVVPLVIIVLERIKFGGQ
jgi:hypothetical protein